MGLIKLRCRILSCEGLLSLSGSLVLILQWKRALHKVFFSRDPLGRRSLLIHKPTSENPHFLLSSVSIGSHPQYTLEELPTESIYILDLEPAVGTNVSNHILVVCSMRLPRQY